MKKSIFLATLTAASLVAGAALAQSTLERVEERGELNCGVPTILAGFAILSDVTDEWEGFDVAICRAVAAAVLGDPSAVAFHETPGPSGLDALASGEVDMLARSTPWTFGQDISLDVDFIGVSYYDGQGFMVPRDLGISTAMELDGETVCVEAGSTNALNLEDVLPLDDVNYETLQIETHAEAREQYLEGACAVYTTDRSGLAAMRATFEEPAAHVILSEIVSKEPRGPLVRHGDNQWSEIVRWTLNGLIAAEEFGITSTNVSELASGTDNPEINRMLGTEAEYGAMLGLERDWLVNVISSVGNYGEIFEGNIGENTPIGLARGLNAQWTQGGLLYAFPFR